MAVTIGSNGITFNDSSVSISSDISYKDYTSPSRTIGTTYTNSTGRPLAFWATMGHNATNSQIVAQVNGSTVARVACNSSATQQSHSGVFLIVPIGGTYSLNIVTSSPNSSYWTEA